MKEIWKPVPGYEGKYEVSNMGRVRSLDRTLEYVCPKKGTLHARRRGVILKPIIQPDGYARVCLCSNARPVHVLVAAAFLGHTPGTGLFVNHMDGVKHHNSATNLELVTGYGNMQHALESGLVTTNKKVVALTMQGDHAAVFLSIKEAARVVGVYPSCISRAVNGRTKNSGGFLWRYSS